MARNKTPPAPPAKPVPTQPRFAPAHKVYRQLPTDKQIFAIPLSKNAEFALNDKEMRRLRHHLYKINHDGIRRYRTMREMTAQGLVLLVWRIK